MKVSFSRRFESDLNQIQNYISFTLSNKKSSQRIVKSIFEGIDCLKDNPFIGSEISAFFSADGFSFRKLFVGSYVVIYRILENEVVIERVFHCRRNYISLLFSNDGSLTLRLT